MPRLRVVFDTNAYVGFAEPDFAKLVAQCASHGIIGLASFWVAHELLAHVADQGDEKCRRSCAAIRRLVRHCAQYDGRRQLVRFIGDGDATVSRELFGRPAIDERDNANDYGTLLGVVSEAADPREWSLYQSALDKIRGDVAERERDFQERMWQAVIQSHLPNAKKWTWDALSKDRALREWAQVYFDSHESLRAPAIALVDGMAARCHLSLNAEQHAQAVERALGLFPTPMHFTRLVARKVALDGFNLSKPKNANSVWDLQLAYSTSCKAIVEGAPLWFLSDDALLLDAACEAKSERVFRRLSHFRELIDQPTDVVIDEIGRSDPESG